MVSRGESRSVSCASSKLTLYIHLSTDRGASRYLPALVELGTATQRQPYCLIQYAAYFPVCSSNMKPGRNVEFHECGQTSNIFSTQCEVMQPRSASNWAAVIFVTALPAPTAREFLLVSFPENPSLTHPFSASVGKHRTRQRYGASFWRIRQEGKQDADLCEPPTLSHW